MAWSPGAPVRRRRTGEGHFGSEMTVRWGQIALAPAIPDSSPVRATSNALLCRHDSIVVGARARIDHCRQAAFARFTRRARVLTLHKVDADREFPNWGRLTNFGADS